jgi:Right handed beta helix region
MLASFANRRVPENMSDFVQFGSSCNGNRLSRTLLALLISTVATTFAVRLSAETFYVDCGRGADSGNGHSVTSAWQHLEAVNSFARKQGLHPGDSILLKRGCRWHEQLELVNSNSSGPLANSGKDGAPITISAYGSGDLPTIDGADTAATDWKPVGAATFVARIDGLVYKVFADGDRRETKALSAQPNYLGQWSSSMTYHMWDYVTNNGMTFGAMKDVDTPGPLKNTDWYHAPALPPEQQLAGLANVTGTPGSWFLDTKQGMLFVHLQNGSNPSQHQIQVTRRRYGIELVGVSHVAIDGIRIIHAAKSGILATVYEPNQGGLYMSNEYNTVRNGIFWNNGDVSMDVLPRTGMQGEGAIYVAASSKTTDKPLRGWVIEGNAVGAIDSERFATFGRSGLSITATEGLILRNNYIATDDAMGVSVFTDRGPRCIKPSIESNYFAANQGNLRISGCTDPVADSNTISFSYGYGIQIGGNSSGAVITHNVMHHLTVTPKGHAFNGVDCNGGAPGGTLAFNTIESVWAAEATLEVGCDHWTVRQNVFDSSNNAQHGGLTLYIRKEALPGMMFERNIYRVYPAVKRQFNVGAGTPGAQTFHDFAWWRANVEPTAKLAAQPLFHDSATSDYVLRDAKALEAEPRAALPVHPFVHNTASTIYLKESLNWPWEPQDKFR